MTTNRPFAIGYTGHRPRHDDSKRTVGSKPFIASLNLGNVGNHVLSATQVGHHGHPFCTAPYATTQVAQRHTTSHHDSAYTIPQVEDRRYAGSSSASQIPAYRSDCGNIDIPYGVSSDTCQKSRHVSQEEYHNYLDQMRADGSNLQLCRNVPQFAAMNELPGQNLMPGKMNGGSRQVNDNFVSKVVEKFGKAVVRVETERSVNVSMQADIFSFFFGGNPEKHKTEKIRGCGSGFCIEGNTILTNAHVIQGAENVSVVFPNGQRQRAEILGVDDVLDLACLQISKPSPQVINLGGSSNLKQGDWAVVLGHPLGLNNTVTLGIISSLDRSSGETGWDWMRHPLIQTDAAVNQGNSGGPLLNELGQCVGIISMRALFGEGIGFAIPIDAVKVALPLLLKKKIVPHAYLGIKMSTVDDDSEIDVRKGSKDSKKSNNSMISAIYNPSRVKIDAILDRSPALKGQLKQGDIITDFDGVPIKKMEEVQRKVREALVGKKIRIKILRKEKNGKEIKMNISVTAGDVTELKKVQQKAKEKEENEGAGTKILIIPRPSG